MIRTSFLFAHSNKERVMRVTGLHKAGISVFTTGAVSEFILIIVALAKIESPTSYTWATLHIAALLVLISGLIIIGVSRQRK
jgi:hypothetical protein